MKEKGERSAGDTVAAISRGEREEDGCLCATGAERRMYGVKAAFAMLRAVKLGASFFEAYR